MVKKYHGLIRNILKNNNGEDLFSSESDIDNINDDYLTTCYGDDFDSNFIFLRYRQGYLCQEMVKKMQNLFIWNEFSLKTIPVYIL